MMRWGVIASALALSACGGGQEASEPSGGEPSGGGEGSTGGFRAACEAMFTRQRECAEALVPQLVALRVRLDRPPGIAARDAAEGRDALVAIAREEHATHTTDEGIAARCDGIVAQMDPSESESASESFTRCAAMDDCARYTECDLALLEAHWSSQAE